MERFKLNTRNRQMENKNPQAVLDAVIESPKTFGNVTIGEITILKYAYLEKVKSPLLDTSVDFSMENVVPSIFILASDGKTLRKYGTDVEALKLDSLEWADENLRLEDVPEVIKAMVSRLTEINKAAPNGTVEDDPKKK